MALRSMPRQDQKTPMKPLSNTESRRLERMWQSEAGEQERMKQKAEDTVQRVLREAEEKFQQQRTQRNIQNEHTKQDQ